MAQLGRVLQLPGPGDDGVEDVGCEAPPDGLLACGVPQKPRFLGVAPHGGVRGVRDFLRSDGPLEANWLGKLAVARAVSRSLGAALSISTPSA